MKLFVLEKKMIKNEYIINYTVQNQFCAQNLIVYQVLPEIADLMQSQLGWSSHEKDHNLKQTRELMHQYVHQKFKTLSFQTSIDIHFSNPFHYFPNNFNFQVCLREPGQSVEDDSDNQTTPSSAHIQSH